MWRQSTACLPQSLQNAAQNHKVVSLRKDECLCDFHVNTKARLQKNNGKDSYINNAFLHEINTRIIMKIKL